MDQAAETIATTYSAAAGPCWVGWESSVAGVLSASPFNVLNGAFKDAWTTNFTALGLVLAFVFGFSERLVDQLIGQAETAVGGKLESKKGDDQSSQA